MKNIFLISMILFLIYGCFNKASNADEFKIEKKKTKKQSVEFVIPKNVDSDFRCFLNLFNKDSVFQVSRLGFPIKIYDFKNKEFELSERLVNEKEYSLKQIRFSKINEKEVFDEYEQIIKLKNNSALIIVTGIENGIAVEYEFKKINKKWKLISWTDQST
ncbi:MAG: DUF4348 domain-containing protein [Tenacibaculum sp.]